MKSNINQNPLRSYLAIPSKWSTFNGEMYNTLPPERHYQDGFRDIVIPQYNTETQRLGGLIISGDTVTYQVIALTEEEIKSRTEQERASKQSELIEAKKTEQAMNAFQMITDPEEALAVKEVYPAWSVEDDYLKNATGHKVTRTLKGSEGYEVRLFALIQPHTPQVGYEPENTPALWSEIKMQGETEVWTQPTGGDGKYVFGAVVTHKGQTWENIHPAPSLNVWEPGVFGWQVKA